MSAVRRPWRASSQLTSVLIGVAILLALAAPAAAQTDELEVRNIDAGSFPLVRAVVAGPAITGDPREAFEVVEDGEPVRPDVVRLRTNELNVVIALDVSGSMAGEPLDAAKAAVGQMLDALPPDVPVSIITFGEGVTVQHAFTTDRTALQAAVDVVAAGGGTALRDAIGRGLDQLGTRAGASALVVLADGADSTSATSQDEVLQRLAADDVTSSFVALQTPDQDMGSIAALADAAGGQVVAVEGASQLEGVFADIGAGFGGLYELRWRSASEGDRAELAIAVAGTDVEVQTTYEHPTVRQFVPDVASDVRVVPGGGILAGAWVPVVAALAVSVGAALLVHGLRSADGAVERREERRRSKDAAAAAAPERVSGVQERLEGLSAQVLAKGDRGRLLDRTLDQAGLSMRANEFVASCASILIAAVFVGILLFGVPFFLLVVVPVAAGIPAFLRIRTDRRRKKFVEQLPDTLQLISGSLTAGYGLGQTLDSVARETESPTREEFQRVVMETRLGRSLDDALDAMSHRIQARDFDWVVDAIKIQSSVGGNLSEIIDQVAETIRSRVRIKRQVDALTAEGKISALVLFVLPFGLFGFIFTSNPDYIRPMFGSGIGQAMLAAAAVMLTAGGLWLKKLVNPEF